MRTVVNEFVYEIVIQKSRFIGILNHLNSVEEVKDILARVKKEYPKATHYCYGYVFEGTQKSNDDGEPSSTAGKPILETLLKNNLTNVLLIVVRYFGGIKLGAGGLTRAYVDSATQVIKTADIYRLVNTSVYKAVINYNLYEIFKKFASNNDINIINVDYLENIELIISSENLDVNILKEYLLNKIEITYLKEEIVLIKDKMEGK